MEPSLWRNLGKWTVAFVFFLALSATLISLQLFQLTSEGASKRTLRRSVAALTEIDPLLDRNFAALQQQAQNAKPGQTVELQDFPVDVPLKPDDVNGASRDQVRDLLLDRSADALYARRHRSAPQAARGSGSIGRFTISGLTHDGLGFLRSRNHDLLGITTIVLASISGVLAVALVLLCRGFGRLGAVGGVLIAAAAPLLLFGIGARFYMRILSDGDTDYIEHEFLVIGQGLAWIPIRDGAGFLVLGLVFVAIAIGGARWADSHRSRRTAGLPRRLPR